MRELWQWLAGQEPQPLQRTGRCLSYGQIAYWALGEVLKEHLGVREGDFTREPPPSARRPRGAWARARTRCHPRPASLIARDRFQDAWVELFTELTAGATGDGSDRGTCTGPRSPCSICWSMSSNRYVARCSSWRPPDPSSSTLTRLRASHGRDPDARAAGGRGCAGVDRTTARSESTRTAKRRSGPGRGKSVLPRGGAGIADRPGLARATKRKLDDERASRGLRHAGHGPGVVAARIDLLDPAEKEALQAASVIGRTFWSGPVYELCPDADPDLRQLEQRDFVDSGSALRSRGNAST